MSTNINITVGDKALLDAAKQQQGANRQAQLHKEGALRLEAKATTARTTGLAAQGRDANGNLITGAPFKQPQIDRRPTANRQSLDYYVAELRNTAIYQTQDGAVKLDLTTEDGTPYSFNLASTFAYLPTDTTSTGLGTVYVIDPSRVNVNTTYSPAGVENEPLYEYFADTSRLANYTPPPWGNNFSRTDVYTNSTTVAPSRARASLTLLLPLIKDSFILVTVGKGTRFRASTTVTQTEEHTYVAFDDIFAPGGISYRHDFVFGWTSDISEQLDNFQWNKCFYVNKSTCREISAPVVLYELLKDYLEDFSVSIPWQYDTSNYLISRVNNVETVGAFPNKLASTSVFSRSISSPPDFRNKYRLYGFLATNDGQPISTPGVYKAVQLSATDSRFIDGGASILTDVDYMVNNFYGGSYSSLPKFGLQSKVEFLPEYDPKYVGHYRTKKRPIYNRNLVGDELTGLLDKTKIRTFELNALAWDWSNPAYCRQQLLALGFSEADLAP